MTDLKALTDELIAAFLAWDAACLNRPRHPPTNWLITETRRLAAAEQALHMPHNYSTRIAALRYHHDGRPHLRIGDAVQAVIHELLAHHTELKEAS